MFYAIETVEERATGDRYDTIYQHKNGQLLFSCEYLHIFDTKRERDEYVYTYDRADDVTFDGGGEEVSRHFWSARKANYAEAMRVKKENDFIYK